MSKKPSALDSLEADYLNGEISHDEYKRTLTRLNEQHRQMAAPPETPQCRLFSPYSEAERDR